MTFLDYLRALKDDDTPEGDVARDVLADKRAPAGDDYGALRRHIAGSGAPTVVTDLLDGVYADWEAR